MDQTTNFSEAMDPTAVQTAFSHMPKDALISQLADFYKVMADSTRLKLLTALESGELCVSDLSLLAGMSLSAVSHQLKALRAAKLVKSRKDGKTVYYSLDDEHIHSIIKVALTHLLEEHDEPAE